ncbi:MAG: aspartyl protease family protein [Planctomycetota bacterium]
MRILVAAATNLAFSVLAPLMAQDAYFPEDRDRVEVPLELVDFGLYGTQLFVTVDIGGEKGRFQLDTGANLAIDQAFAERLGLERTTALLGIGVTQPDLPYTFRVPLLRLGSVELENYLAIALDLESFDDGAEGLIGLDLLSFAVVEIDAPGRRLVLHEPDTFEPPEGGEPIRLLPALYGVECRTTRRQRWIIDTGNSSAVLLHGPFVRRHDLAANRDAFLQQTMFGVFGEHEVLVGQLAELRLGGLQLRGFPVDLTDPNATGGGAGSALHAGNLGMTLFASLVMLIDGPRRTMRLRAPDGADTIVYRDAMGLALGGDDAVAVLDVAAGSPAHGQGIAAGDVLVAIDGRRVRDHSRAAQQLRAADQVRLTLRPGDAGDELEVTLRRRAWLTTVELPVDQPR